MGHTANKREIGVRIHIKSAKKEASQSEKNNSQSEKYISQSSILAPYFIF
jgi:hypothetical protein